MTVPLTGYADRLSVRPDETICFHVSHQDQSNKRNIRTKVVRVRSADPHTDPGPGIQTEPVPGAEIIECLQEPQPWTVQRGSHAEIGLTDEILQSCREGGCALVVTVMPTWRNKRQPQTIAYLESMLEVYIDEHGYLCAQFGAGEGTTDTRAKLCCSKRILPQNQWIQVYCCVTLSLGTCEVGWNYLTKEGDQGTRIKHGDTQRSLEAGKNCVAMKSKGKQPALILAAAKQTVPGSSSTSTLINHFTGRMEHPWMWWDLSSNFGAHQLELHAKAAINQPVPLQDELLFPPANAQWHFGKDISTQLIRDLGKNQLHGKLFNCPTRGVRGSTWSGREMCWRHAPDDYAAIYFHAETDLADCQWPACYQWTIPSALPSGNYALLLETDDYRDNIPFFVVPPKGTKQSNVAVVMPTFTYVIYGNHARGEWLNDPNWATVWKQQAAQIPGAYPYNPQEHPEYGWSTYNTHADGGGICMASWKRPLLNLRMGYITFPYPEWAASGLRHYPADTHLTCWLESQGISYDIVTDWELHFEGSSVLEPYRVVLTGSHPEYHTEASLNAFLDYRNNGGRLMYMGGNGFYWKIAVGSKKEDPSVLEIRRGEGGVRAWASDPGEYYHQLDGQYGGLWRRNGRAPQALAGVGFSAQGIFVGSCYRLKDNIRTNPRVAWMFEGIDEEEIIIGKHGLSGHGAAGFELDRTDVSLGTPEHAVVVASSEGHNSEAKWLLVFEERLTHHGNLVGVPDQELIRADLTFFETPSGGAVFATGSITYCGSLLTNNCQNDISTLTKNVLIKFLDPHVVFSIPD
jgi:N,N-dimethylformamidase